MSNHDLIYKTVLANLICFLSLQVLSLHEQKSVALYPVKRDKGDVSSFEKSIGEKTFNVGFECRKKLFLFL